MNYFSGESAKVGDLVELAGQRGRGIIVCSFDDEQYADKFPESEWGYLKQGVLIEFINGDLVHLEVADEDLTKVIDESGTIG